MPTRQDVEAEARSLEQWVRALRIGPAQLPGANAEQRAQRARDLVRASETLMRGAITEALENDDPVRAAHALATVRAYTRLQQWADISAGRALDEQQNNRLWTSLFQLQRATGDVLPARTRRVDTRPMRPLTPPRAAPTREDEDEGSSIGTGAGALGFAILLGLGLRYRPRR